MSRFLNENHWGSPTLALLDVLDVLGVLNVLYVLNVLHVLHVLHGRSVGLLGLVFSVVIGRVPLGVQYIFLPLVICYLIFHFARSIIKGINKIHT